MTVIPVVAGILIRAQWTHFATRLTVYLRPVSMVVLVSVIGFSLLVSIDLVLESLFRAGPAAYVLNISAMCMGYFLARLTRLNDEETLTVSIEVGVQNAAVATFLSLTILNSWKFAIAPTIYGCIMIFNSALLGRILKRRRPTADLISE